MSLHEHIERLDRLAERMKREVRIDLCCNDPDNGLFAGRVAQIEIHSELLTLEARKWNGLSYACCPTVREDGSSIVLAGKRWPITRSKEWFGNWCWNAYWMEKAVALRFLVWLRRRDLFHASEGESSLFDAWNDPDPNAIADLLGLAAE